VELVRLHKAGAIKSEQDASFYAHLIRDFGASFTIRVGLYVPKPGVPNGRTVSEPGKPYVPTAAQRVKVPRGLNRKQGSGVSCPRLGRGVGLRAEELGESVIDLTGDVTSQSAPTVSEPSPTAPVKSQAPPNDRGNSGSKRSSRD
jgi:hypothetical protein